jgi:hypothetical protein
MARLASADSPSLFGPDPGIVSFMGGFPRFEKLDGRGLEGESHHDPTTEVIRPPAGNLATTRGVAFV